MPDRLRGALLLAGGHKSPSFAPIRGRVEPRFFDDTNAAKDVHRPLPVRRVSGRPQDVAFLLRYGIPANILDLAVALAAARGTPAREELFALGFDVRRYWSLLAEELGLAFAERLSEALPHPGVSVPAADAGRLASAALVMLDGSVRLAIAPEPNGIGSLAARLCRHPDLAERLVVVPPAEIRRFLVAHSSSELARRAVGQLAGRMPALSARHIGAPRQSRAPFTLFGVSLVFILIAPGAALWGLAAFMSLFFLNCVLWKLAAALRAPPRPHCEAVPEAALPSYSVLVPLYREESVLADLVEHLARLDYPAAKRQVLLILEGDDAVTRAVVEAMVLPPGFERVLVPPCAPRTKPKALMYALPFATGEYVVVYDAEDRPEFDQLRRAAAAFREYPDLACVQASLEPDNDGSLLAKLFALEYAANFEVILPSLAAWGLPLPLGGTSNHFPRHVLEKTGGWDPFNVTEDADLGIRLARFGLRSTILASRTYEEAPARLAQWFPQRRRWIKGWMQTALLAMPGRLPPNLRLPFRQSLAMHGILTGGVLGLLLYPASIASLAYTAHAIGDGSFSPGPLGWALLGLNGFNLVAILSGSAIAAFRGLRLTGMLRRAWLIPLLPFYWALMSLAAWQALGDLVRSPWRWEKTAHGIARDRRPLMAPHVRSG